MSRMLKIKAGILAAFIVVCVVVMGFILSSMQSGIALDDYTESISKETEELPGLLEEAAAETAENTESFDGVYASDAESIAFMASHDAGYEATNAKMAEYKELLGVDNVLIVDRSGAVIAAAQESPADFSRARFNQLRTVFDSGEPSDPVEVEFAETGLVYRYYAAQIDGETMVVIEQNPERLDQLVEDTGSLQSVLSNVSVGQAGYMFAVSAQNYLVEYHPNPAYIGIDALDAGVDVADLEDGTFAWITFEGESLYCGVTQIDDMYYIGAVPESELSASRNLTVGVILFIFFSVAMIVALYGIFVNREDEKRGGDPTHFATVGPLRINKFIARKAAALSFLGFIAVFVVTFYMQTLFALSAESVNNSERLEDVQSAITRTEQRAADLTEQYNEAYLTKGEVAAYILEHNPSLGNRENLIELADALQVEYLFLFDESGVMTASSSPYTNFALSEDPADQSYEFRKLLQGVDHLVQDPMPDEVSGELRQYIGVTLRDANDQTEGFIQLSVHSSRLEALLENVQLDHIIDGVNVGQGGFAFAVSKDDGTFSYFPNTALSGRSAVDYGLSEAQLKGGFNDYATIDGATYFASSMETDSDYVYVAQPASELMSERVPLTVTTAVCGLVCQIVIFLLVVCEPRRRGDLAPDGADGDDSAGGPDGEGGSGDGQEPDEPDDPRMFDVTMPSGRRAKTESAASRWLYKSLNWGEKSAEQRVLTVIKVLVSIFAIAVCIAVLLSDVVFPQDSVFRYILDGGWERGLNVFAITACIMIACVVLTVTMLVRELLRLLAGIFGARGETMCRLISSFIKYVAIIGMVYYCLMVIGIDTTTLLASAGILSIAISFGAKELVSDILSGLFIIFEGEFRVGDIIQASGKSGTVVEIGVRTTKINDGNGNIIIIRNSEVSNVVNMTKELSYAVCDMGIEYGESLERVESILDQEFPNIRRRFPAIEDGPFYKGVVALEDNCVTIRVIVQCAESARGQLERDLRREMKLIFDEYQINIPYPQVVVHQPIEYKKATVAEQLRADRFNAEQKVAARDIGNEEYEDEDRR